MLGLKLLAESSATRLRSLILTAGLDQGTTSYEVVVLEEVDSKLRLVMEKTFSTPYVKMHPEAPVKSLTTLGRTIDCSVVPSGFGSPLKDASALSDEEFFEMSLKKEDPGNSSLARVIKAFVKNGVKCYVTPSVRQLPTIPRHRRYNRIDMGTSDKVCSAALGVYTLWTSDGTPPNRASFVLVELGSAFNAYLMVQDGQIIDGVGGTNCWMGMSARGSVDGEVAALAGSLRKEDVYAGGALYLASGGNGNSTPEELAAYAETGVAEAVSAADAYVEGVARDVGGLVYATGVKPSSVFLSGRVARINYFNQRIIQRLRKNLDIRKLETMGSNSKEAALGAALVANGLAGGLCSSIVENMKLKGASGGVLSDVQIPGQSGKTYTALK